MAEDPQPMTLQQRIASLNAAHVGRTPGELPPTSTRPKPQMPDRRPIVKQKSFNFPNEKNISTTTQPSVGNTPKGPPPLPSRKQPPPLPTRKNTSTPVEQNGTIDTQTPNGYNGPRLTTTRTKSDENRVKAPAWGEVELPPLPAKVEPKSRTKSFNTTQARSVVRTPSASSLASTATNMSNNSKQTAPPPPLPTRKPSAGNLRVNGGGARKVPPLPSNDALERARKASFASSTDQVEVTEPVPPLPSRRPSAVPSLHDIIQSTDTININDEPPPVPRLSKPDLASLQATKPKVDNYSHRQSSQSSSGCMVCRDFSGPDNHAALFPRQHVNSLQDLAYQLTSPFHSHTDKARAIFTWLHLNIDYNVRDFFSGNVRGSTPQSTLQTGLAVCEGYAALFTNIATYAGLESLVIGGHGKGFGYTALAPNSPIPPYEAGHAWNAVRIDNGQWKLIDACWGAGHVQGKGMPYTRKFAPERFTQSNEEFSLDHFPENRDHFFLPNGRTMTWPEYISINPATHPYTFERPTFFDNAKTDYSIGKHTLYPCNRHLSVSQSTPYRFQFALFCPHWSLEKHTKKGLPPVFILALGGVDGRNKHFVPLNHIPGDSAAGGGGDVWYVDVHARELGAPGETLTLFAVSSFGNRSEARGLTVKEFKEGVGRVGMGFVGVAAWELIR